MPKVVFLCAKWPILSSILLVIVDLLLSRVLNCIIDSASRASTLSNPLVGLLILVDLVLILLSLDRCLRWNILFSYMNPFSIAARRTGGKVLRSLLGIRIQVIRSFLTVYVDTLQFLSLGRSVWNYFGLSGRSEWKYIWLTTWDWTLKSWLMKRKRNSSSTLRTEKA